MKRLILSILIIFALSAISSAQTAGWLIPPGAYSDITRLGPHLLKVSKKGKIALITTGGETLAPLENDLLTGFYEDRALLLRNDAQGERVMGCVSSSGRYTPFKDFFYTLNGQKFYSDGLLSVADDKGRLGYIDDRGNRVVGFDGKYNRIKPFTEGFAAVFKNKKYHLVNKSGTPVKFLFDGVGEVYGGTNVCNGLAYIWDTDGNVYTYDVKRGGTCKKFRNTPRDTSFDYLYRFAEISGKGKNAPFSDFQYSGSVNASAEQKDGLYGFTKNGKTILPAQFSAATDFQDGFAVVTIHGEKGMLSLIDESTFEILAHDATKKFYANEDINCEFNILCPPSYAGKKLSIEIRDSGGASFPLTGADGIYRFSHRPGGESGIKEFSLSLSCEGIHLLDTSLQYTFVKKQRCNICGKDKELCGGHASQASVSKSSSEPVCATCGKKISECKWAGVH